MKINQYLKILIAYILIFSSIYIAFRRGKNQGHLECIDFSVLPILDNLITIIISTTFVLIGIKLLSKKTSKS